MTVSAFTFINNLDTTLAAAASAASTSLTLASALPFPSSIPTGLPIALTLNDVATGQQFEVVYATAIAGNIVTVQRAQEGTAALAWAVGDSVRSGPTAGQMEAVQNGGPAVVHIAGTEIVTGAKTFSAPIMATGKPAPAGASVAAVIGSNYAGNAETDIVALTGGNPSAGINLYLWNGTAMKLLASFDASGDLTINGVINCAGVNVTT